jgi:preprotein translocase subunit SecA
MDSLQGLMVAQVVERFQQEAQRAYEALETQVGEAASQLHAEHGIQLLGLDDDPSESLPEGTVLTDDEQQERLHPLRRVEREILLKTIDAQWIEYLHNLDALREGIGLRAYGQKDPLLEYKREAYDMFQNLTWAIQHEVLSLLFRSRIEIAIDMPAEFPPPEQPVMA